ncbi:MAG: hypothetical protein JRG70_11240 [Deltaproteobacteria bacterium]|nr:hypothetical protein [Deltaproteobacteria bacterium]
MKLSGLILISAFAGALSVLGCGDNNSVSDTANELCNRKLCQTNDVLINECLEVVTACLNEPNANRDECAIVAGEKCDGG